MNAKVSFALAGFACFALTGPVAGSVEDRLAALERRVAELEQRLGGAKESPTAQASLQDGVTDLREKVKLRYDKDVAEYGKSAMREIERLYRAFSKTGDAAAFDELLKRFPKACRTGCAVMYAGQRAKGDEAVKWFKKAIADHGDCYYGDGVCVGAYARLYLASIYAKQGKTSEAEKLQEEIRTQFPDAVTHKGRPMKDAL